MKRLLLLFGWLLAVICANASPAASLLQRAEQAAAQGRLTEARAIATRVVQMNDAALRGRAMELLGTWNMTWLQSGETTTGKRRYQVREGDVLSHIARREGVTVGLLRIANGLRTDAIRIGQTLWIPNGRWTLHVDKSDNVMDLHLSGRFFKRYIVATGRDNYTPVGTWTITTKIEHPEWTRPTDKKVIPFGDPENELGTHWMAWNREGFGIHGTWDNASLGHQASAGCVRMHNDDVAELFALVPSGTQVEVVD